MIQKQVDMNIVLEQYRAKVAELSHELIMVKAYSTQLEKEVEELTKPEETPVEE